jgi:hypothetical protein
MASSLKRGRVCNLLLLLGFASAVSLRCESHGTRDHNLLSQFFRLPQPGESGLPYLYPPGTVGPVIPPGTGFPFRRLLWLAGLRRKYSYSPPHGQNVRQWSSTWGTQNTLGGMRKHLTGCVKLKKGILFGDKQWINMSRFRVTPGDPGTNNIGGLQSWKKTILEEQEQKRWNSTDLRHWRKITNSKQTVF